MAIVRAIKTGNWSDTTVWNTGALPTSADDVYSNTFTVTIDVSPTVLRVSNASTTGVTVGGWFVPTNGITLTCTGAGAVSGTGSTSGTALISSSLTIGQSFTINANLTASLQSVPVLQNTSSGTVNLIGNVFTASHNITHIINSSTGVINVTGNVTGGSTNSPIGILNSGTGTVNVTGNVTGGTANNTAYGITNSSGGTVNVTGNVTGGSGGSSNIGIINTSTGAVNITGSIIGGASLVGFVNSSSGVLTHVGSVFSGNNAAGVGVGSASQVTILTGPFITNSTGVNPVTANRWFWQNTSPPSTYYQIRSANLAVIRPLYTADSVGGNPAVTNVRSGTIYGPSNELTGTCAVPPASAVAAGVPVDNTTGTAIITGAALRAELAPELARMANCATTNEVADIVDGAI